MAALVAEDRFEGQSRLNPLVITAGLYGRASLSKLQIFLFSLIVVWMLIYFLLAKSEISDLSGTVLVLLGVSAAGTLSGKLTAVERKRISLENWTWLINKSWIKESIQPARKPASFRDLMTSGKEFDVSKFQMLAVSVFAGCAMIVLGLEAGSLADFKVPENVLVLLGLGQVVYVGGKAVGSSTETDLDARLTSLRKLEDEFVNAVSKAWKLNPPAAPDKAAAMHVAPEEYNHYRKSAEEVAIVVKNLINAPAGQGPQAQSFDPYLPQI
jgi:hypothetical protein